MTIAELIQTLSHFDPAIPVVVRGYEGGYNDVSVIEPLFVQRNVNEKWYYGAHDCVKEGDVSDQPLTQVMYLGGFNPICDQPELSYH